MAGKSGDQVIVNQGFLEKPKSLLHKLFINDNSGLTHIHLLIHPFITYYDTSMNYVNCEAEDSKLLKLKHG